MKPIYQPDVQAQMDAYLNQIRRVQKGLADEFERKMNQRTGHIRNALETLYRENIPIRYELTELEKIELQEMNDEIINQ